MKQRGWTTATLAVRWGISENWLNKIIGRDDLRPAHYSDAFSGLPFYQPTPPTVRRNSPP
jgi:hypothetical protein